MDDFNFFSAYFLCVFQVYKIFTPMFSNKTNQLAFSQGGTGLGADSSLETAYSFSCMINLDSKEFPFPCFPEFGPCSVRFWFFLGVLMLPLKH